MPGVTIEVENRITGASRDTSASGKLLLELLVEEITVAELIRRTVEEQVHEMLVKRRIKAEEARTILDRRYLTAEDVCEQSQSGAVRYPSKRSAKAQAIDPEEEVCRAQHAFNDRKYFLLVDGRQMDSLDEVITFAPGSKVTFLRLMPLVGG